MAVAARSAGTERLAGQSERSGPVGRRTTRIRPPRRLARTTLFALFLLLAGAPLTAQAGPTIRGVVVGDDQGTPVMGAEVLVQSTPLRALTGDDGSFEIPVPDEGTYTLFVIADGFGNAEVTADPAATASEPLRISLEPQLFDVPGVTVTASRTTVRPGDAPVSVAILSGEEIQRRDVTNLKEALPFAQGVTFNAGHLDIRGSSGFARGVGSRVLMLLDGHRALTGAESRIDYNILPLLDVDRVEIVKGPNSTLWGTNAMAGVVNVITRPPLGPPRTAVRGYYGVFDTPGNLDFTDERLSMRGLQIQHSRQVGGAGVTVFAGREGSDGFRQNGGQERWHWRAKAVFGAESSKPLEVFASGKREDVEEFFTWLSPERRLEVDPADLGDWKRHSDLIFGLTATPVVTSTLKLQLRPQVQHVRNQNYFHDNEDSHRSTRFGTDLQLSFFSGGRHAVTVGGEASRTGVTSNFLSPTPDVTDLALFVQDEIGFSERLRGSAGIRLDSHKASVVAGDLTLNPKIGLVFDATPDMSLRTSLSRGYRSPSVVEQFTRTTTFGFRVVPNLELRGESAWAGEVGTTIVPNERLWLDAGLESRGWRPTIDTKKPPMF
ncbi:MAG: TonB-dependent receptor, partial [Gammaproteobacteria bacterium]|nr:TonB-dependent receptor [Gammaproteobacteria bacterium]